MRDLHLLFILIGDWHVDITVRVSSGWWLICVLVVGEWHTVVGPTPVSSAGAVAPVGRARAIEGALRTGDTGVGVRRRLSL